MSVPIPQTSTAELEEGQHVPEKTTRILPGQNAIIRDNDSIHTSSPTPSIARIPSKQDQEPKSFSEKLTKTITTRSNAGIIDPGPPPDGGLKAWTQALMGHLVVFNTWGMISSFSVFQAYYTSELGLEPSAVSWIGSVQMLGHFFLGMLSGRAFDGGLFYWVIIPGAILTSLGMFMTSLCSQYWQLFLAQGVLNGIGCGLQFTPTTSLVFTYFSSNRVVAMAIVASGSATGGLVYPAVARELLPRIGFSWTTRVMGFMMLGIAACYIALLKPRLPPRKSGPLLEPSAFKEAPYTLYIIGVFLTCFGQYFGFYYIGSFTLEVLGLPYSTSVNVLMIMNGVGLVGRIIPGYLADLKFGGYNTLIPFVFASAIVMYCWSSVTSEAGLYTFATLYGFTCAGFQGLFPSTLGALTKDISKVGVRNGMGFAFVGIAALTGPPIAGALVQQAGGHYLTAQMWAGSMIVVGGVMMVLGRIAKTGLVFRVKV